MSRVRTYEQQGRTALEILVAAILIGLLVAFRVGGPEPRCWLNHSGVQECSTGLSPDSVRALNEQWDAWRRAHTVRGDVAL